MKHLYLKLFVVSMLLIGVNNISAQVATVTTDSVSKITATTFAGYGDIINNGNDANISAGFCYSTSPNPTKANEIIVSYSNPIGPFTASVSGLYPDTTYYVRAYATTATGTYYGSQLQFKTAKAMLAVITTDSINTITATTVTGYGTLTNDGNDPTLTSGFCYSASSNPTIADSSAEKTTGGSTGFFSTAISNLKPNTTYYVRAYATNAAGTAYGSVILHFTTGNATLATVTTDSIGSSNIKNDVGVSNNITATTAVGYGTLTNNGNDPDVIEGFCYSTSPVPTIADSVTPNIVTNETTKNFLYTFNLSPDSTYYFRAYATNAAGTAYGNPIKFTMGKDSLPTVTTDSVINITATSAVVYANLTDNGNVPGTLEGFCYSTSPDPTKADSTTDINGNLPGVYYTPVSSKFVPELTPNTTYYVRAYAYNVAGISYGKALKFTTTNVTLAIIITDSITNITDTTAIGYGNVTNNGNDPFVSEGICYSISPNPTIADNVEANQAGGYGSFNAAMSGLSPNTTYYVRAYATNAAGTSYGNELSFTAGEPTLTTPAASSVTATTAMVGGTIIDTGDISLIIRGVVWSTSANPTIALTTKTTDKVGAGGGLGTFTDTITGLTASTTYYARAYAINKYDTVYGNEITFTTPISTGIENYKDLKTNFSVYPNPTNGALKIDFISQEDSEVEISLLNALGVTINSYKNTAISGNNTVVRDLSGIISGIYFVQIKMDGGVLGTQKIIKTE